MDIRYSSNIMANKIRILFCIWTILLFAGYRTEAFIGMTWGRQSAQRLIPSQAVDLLLQNGIRHARIYSSEIDILKAFVNTGIELTVNAVMKYNQFLNMTFTRNWVQMRSEYLVDSNIRHIPIGRYVFYEGLKNQSVIEEAMKAMTNLQQALDEGGYDRVTTNMVHLPFVLKPNISRPSEAEFCDEIKYQMTEFARIVNARGSPFMIDMIPILDARRKGFNLSFALGETPRSGAAAVVEDVNGATYTNIFDFTYDSFVWALTKVGYPDVRVLVTQVGWPTDGHRDATAAHAERFFKNLLPAVASGQGTPMRPGEPVDIFVHALADETRNPDPITRHWGVYRSNGQPKYEVDLTGQGRNNIYPTAMGGILRMPRRWCVFNGNKTDMFKVKRMLKEVCDNADCSSTAEGGSCGGLTFDQKVSYAFNMRFQFLFQDEKECAFGGLGRLSLQDPSVGECVFPIEVVKGSQVNLVWNGARGA